MAQVVTITAADLGVVDQDAQTTLRVVAESPQLPDPAQVRRFAHRNLRSEDVTTLRTRPEAE